MAKKRRRKKSSKGKDLAATIIGGIIALPILLPIGILYGLLRALVGLFKLFSGERAREEKLHRSFAEIDQLDGRAFEHFVAGLLRKNGYSNVQVTKASGDYGVDIVADKDGVRWAFQCKRYNGSLGLKPTQEVFAGAKKYDAARAVVVTNSHFTKNAVELGRSLGVTLWDRQTLSQLISNVEREEDCRQEKRAARLDKIGRLLDRADRSKDEYDMTKDRYEAEYNVTKD